MNIPCVNMVTTLLRCRRYLYLNSMSLLKYHIYPLSLFMLVLIGLVQWDVFMIQGSRVESALGLSHLLAILTVNNARITYTLSRFQQKFISVGGISDGYHWKAHHSYFLFLVLYSL